MFRSQVRCLLCFALFPVALGHGQLTVPLVRGDSQGRRESYEQRAPVFTLGGNRGGYSATSMRCHDFLPDGPQTSLQAGGSFEATWTMEAGHPGDCYFYLSYDSDPAAAVNFFKFAALPGCGAPDGLNIPASVTMAVQLPAELPPCDHCVLRWEWTAHQQVSDIEFYVQCADVSITSAAGPVMPSPMTAIAGIEHLPRTADGYRKVYNGQGPEEQYLVGPAVASYSPCAAGTPGCISSAAPDDTSTDDASTSSSNSATSDSSNGSTSSSEATSTTSFRSSMQSTTESTTAASDYRNCPLPGRGLPSFVTECYCGFATSGTADRCGPDDGTACWCRCCCHFSASGTCRYEMPEDFSSSVPLGVAVAWLALLLQA